MRGRLFVMPVVVMALTVAGACTEIEKSAATGELTDDQIENIVRQSYRFVAMYNVINKGAMMEENPMRTRWNGTFAAAGLLDHTMRAIARPNNDTL